MAQKPLLSIGIIFKNEIRCLERCVKSLQPLRDAAPCELVMADTGSDDGSREVAEKYADILFDFPWINDFAAARNAVIDRCTGKWYMTMDADEWLDEDVAQLVEFLNDAGRREDFCTLVIRNYASADTDGSYSDFLAVRMVRASLGARYEGAIHEAWDTVAKSIFVLNRTIFHHDGYVGMGAKQGIKKRARNMSLLREELKKEPDSLLRRLQCLESSSGDSDHEEYVRLAVEGVRKKLPTWQTLGPAILRGAVNWAAGENPEELERLEEDAHALFPDSMYTRLDINCVACSAHFQKKEYGKAITSGDAYLRAMEDYHSGICNLTDMLYSTVGSVSPRIENHMRLMVAESCFQVKDYLKSKELLTAIEYDKLDLGDFKNCVGIMLNLQSQGGLDLFPAMVNVWNWLDSLDKNDPMTVQRKSMLIAASAVVFPQKYRDAETNQGFGHAYTVFLPLAGKFEMGTAAQILETADAGEIEAQLRTVKNWVEFPIHALAHAIEHGVRFPLPDKPLKIEDMDAFASRLAQDRDSFLPLALDAARRGGPEDWQGLVWTRGLLLAAVKVCDWKEPGTGMELARTFAGVEGRFVSRCYAPGMLTDEAIWALPPMHRFGWYCAKAFEAKDADKAAECVRLLRKGLETAPEMKSMVEFLLEQIEREEKKAAIASAPPELLELAGQVRGILNQYPPDDPAVKEIKNSPVYQKVAYLIEEPATPGLGGIRQ